MKNHKIIYLHILINVHMYTTYDICKIPKTDLLDQIVSKLFAEFLYEVFFFQSYTMNSSIFQIKQNFTLRPNGS